MAFADLTTALDTPPADAFAWPPLAERHVDGLDTLVNEFVRLGGYRHLPPEDGVHLALSLTYRVTLAVAALRRAGWTREEVVARLEPARLVHADSPFVRRLQVWPRGYQGDFETVEQMVQQENRATPGRLAYWLEQTVLDSAPAQQHRNKVDLQATAILETVLALGAAREPRLLILAAGGSPDLRQVQTVLRHQRFRAVLLDQDADALAFSAARLAGLADRLTLVRRNVVRGLHDVRAHGPFDLVLAGGLFDYLPRRVAVMILAHARQHLLAPGGTFLFTNIADANPHRPWMEHMADWCLIHRSDEDTRALCLEAGFSVNAVELTRERTGLTQIVRCGAGHTGDAPRASARGCPPDANVGSGASRRHGTRVMERGHRLQSAASGGF